MVSPVRRWPGDRRFTGGNGHHQVLVNRYKYERSPERAARWGNVLARVLAGYLTENNRFCAAFDHIIPNPIFVSSEGKRQWDHIGKLLRSTASLLPDTWQIRDAEYLIRKTGDTTPMIEATTWPKREEAAKELRKTLELVTPVRVKRTRVLVFDDVFTRGSTINEVAGLLRRAGALQVATITLARQPWRQQSSVPHDEDLIPF